MIYFDLDGVIRDLCGITNQEFPTWCSDIQGMNFIEYFDKNLHLLLEAPPTEYYTVINNYSKDIVIMTSQPENWRQNTIKWIDAYFSNRDIKIIFDDKKLHFLAERDFLVEDYPYFENYSQIVLVKRPYNKDVKGAYLEISCPEELEKFLESEGEI